MASSLDPHEGNFRESAALCPRPPALRGGLFGDVWQWTCSSYAPYPGFAPAAGGWRGTHRPTWWIFANG